MKWKASKREKERDWLALGKFITHANSFWDAVVTIRSLRRISTKLDRLNEMYCNGQIEEEQFDKEQKPLQNKVNILCENLPPLYAKFQNDPRGAAVSIFIKVEDGFKPEGWNITNLLY